MSDESREEIPTGLKITGEIRKAFREALSELSSTVELELYVDREGGFSRIATDLAELIAQESEGKVSLKTYVKEENPDAFKERGVDKTPTFSLCNGAIRYIGVPLAEELPAFIETLIRISKSETKLSDETEKWLKQLNRRFQIQVVVTMSCPYSPYAVLLANMFAFSSNGMVTSEAIEALDNLDIVDEHGITAVPTVLVNGKVAFVGLPREDQLLKYLVESE